MELKWGSIDSAFYLVQFLSSMQLNSFQAAEIMDLGVFTFLHVPKSKCDHDTIFQYFLFGQGP